MISWTGKNVFTGVAAGFVLGIGIKRLLVLDCAVNVATGAGLVGIVVFSSTQKKIAFIFPKCQGLPVFFYVFCSLARFAPFANFIA